MGGLEYTGTTEVFSSGMHRHTVLLAWLYSNAVLVGVFEYMHIYIYR